MENKKNNCLANSHRVGLFFVLLFVICFVWFYIRPVEQGLHLNLLRLSYFGYDGMNVTSFIFGAIQSYIWGYIAVGLWYLTGGCPIYKMLKK